MSKDPAFLFYYQAFQHGTRRMNFAEKGAYIELLCEQADCGHLSIDDIKRILKDDFTIWDSICCKFIEDDSKKYFNPVLEENIEKRRNFVKSRKNNLKAVHMGKHMNNHMDKHMIPLVLNKNVNENKKVFKGGIRGEKVPGFGDRFEEVWARYPDKDGKRDAERHFKNSVKTEQDWKDINKALDNYLQTRRVKEGYPKAGKTWFYNWQDFIDYQEPLKESEKEDEIRKSIIRTGS